VRKITEQRHLYALKNAELNGKLVDTLTELRSEGKSLAQIAKQLSAVGTRVAKTTVFEWVQNQESQIKSNIN